MNELPDLTLTHIGSLVSYNPDRNTFQEWKDCECSIQDGKVMSIGKHLPETKKTLDCQGKLVTPGFVDAHTHPVFLHGRETEFLKRLGGASYEEIAAAGGGIQSSIQGVRKASKEELIAIVLRRMDRFLSLGTTTVEAKSGYGLNVESELKSLEVLDRVNEQHPIDIIPTFLGAHSIPAEYTQRPDDYVNLICDEMLPAVADQGVARFCDVFCERGYFSVDQSRKILAKARTFGLGIRLHADEFMDSRSAELAAELKASSADHLMAISDAGIRALSESGTIATLLPGTTFFLGQTSYAPYQRLAKAGIEIALATDFNPGSSHIQSMPFIIALACIYLKMPVEAALISATWVGAKSLGLENRVGHLMPGAQADLILWDLDSLVQIPYSVGNATIRTVLKSGIPV
ncbi:MAG: imidazolonepropionase [FCB group bacterium]|nr:imidazolonepropionase [FCB group bacterium]